MNWTRHEPIFIAADHAGVDLKQSLQRLLREFQWTDLGPNELARVDYPDFARKVAGLVSEKPSERKGVLVCGTGIGMAIAANKFVGIRAAVVENPVAARLAREHNDANILCLGSRFLAPEYASEIVRAWLEADPSHEERHLVRLRKISALESKQ